MRRWVGLALALVAAGCGTPDGGPPPPPEGMICADPSDRMEGLVLAGSGSNLPLVRELTRRYGEGHPEVEMHVPESIGSSGAVRAVLDGAIDVGLASRPLTEEELGAGLVATPLATSVVAFVTDGSMARRGVTMAELRAIFGGTMGRWDDGTPIVPVLREPGDSSHQAIERTWPRLHAAMEGARGRPNALVTHTDQAMADTLGAIEGAVGVLDLGIVRLEGRRLEPLAIDGVAPSVEAVQMGRYRATKPLFFLTRGAPAGAVADFIAFTRSPSMKEVLIQHGYLPPR